MTRWNRMPSIYDYSNGSRTNVTIDGRVAPVDCNESRRCPGTSGGSDPKGQATALAQETNTAVPGLEGVMT
jgi:hypothetical protein